MEQPVDPDHIYEISQKKDHKKAAIILVVRLVPGLETRTRDDLKRIVQQMLEERFANIPWLVLETLTVVLE